MATISLKSRIEALTGVINKLARQLTWDDLNLFVLQVVGQPEDDCVYMVMIREDGANRPAFTKGERDRIAQLMTEHGYRYDWDHHWRAANLPVPERWTPEKEAQDAPPGPVVDDAPEVVPEPIQEPAPAPPRPEKVYFAAGREEPVQQARAGELRDHRGVSFSAWARQTVLDDEKEDGDR